MIHIITDTTANLPQEVLDQYAIPLVPQYVHFGAETLHDSFDISPAEFYARQAAANELPKTSAPSPADFAPHFSRIQDEDPDGTVLCIHPSSEVSGTVRSARLAAAEFPNLDIRIFDTRSVSLGLGLMVWEAARMVRDGADVEVVLERLQYMRDHTQTYFVVDTLEYLAKGGRIGRAQHLLGTLLDIKPILTLVDGVVESHSRARTRTRAIATIRDLILQQAQGKPRLRLGVAHAMCEEEGRALCADLVAALHPETVLFAEIGPSIGVHAGPGTLAACWVSLPY